MSPLPLRHLPDVGAVGVPSLRVLPSSAAKWQSLCGTRRRRSQLRVEPSNLRSQPRRGVWGCVQAISVSPSR